MTMVLHRFFLFAVLAGFCLHAEADIHPCRIQTRPRMRVIIDNDFSGDPDGLFALAHLLLSPSVETRAIIGSHLSVKDGFDPSVQQAQNAINRASTLVKLLKVLDNSIPLIAGSNVAMPNDSTGVMDKAVEFIIQEAMRTDTKLPLYIVCGAGLTEVASALLKKPEIAGKFTLVWIGGPEYPGMAFHPPGGIHREYNLNIDLSAAKFVFNRSTVNIWQVPRDAYRQCLVTFSQLQLHVQSKCPAGKYLYEQLMQVNDRFHINGEAYILGDNPLVLLTALQSYFDPDPSSSKYMPRKAPLINGNGWYQDNPDGREIRVYTHLDTQFMFNDFFDKLQLLNQQ